jgi:hypothetical protein
MNGEKRNAYRLLVGKSEVKRLLGRPILKWILEKGDGMVWIGLIWLRIGTSGTFGFHKMLGSSGVAAQLMAPQEGLSSVSK